jgi:hypothetical protein
VRRAASAAGHRAGAVFLLEKPKTDRMLAALEAERLGVALRECRKRDSRKDDGGHATKASR